MQATQPAFFKQGPKPLTRLLIFSTLSVALMVGDVHFQVLGRVREQVSFVLYPLQWLATAPFAAFHEARDFFTRQAVLIAEHRKLNDQILVARAKAMRVDALLAENEQLRGLALRQQQSSQGSRLTEILYSGRDPFSAKLIVDLGVNGDVKPGKIVVDTEGVVGQVVRVQPMTSEVRLITDRNHAVPVMVQRSRLRTVVYGMGAGQPLEVRYLPPNADIKAGDLLVTSGLDGLYAPGLPVARVTHIERPSGSPFPRIQCQPVAGIDSHRFLLILDNPPSPPPYPAASEPAAKGA
ncbi:rod shape-determining protein MreC [Chitiniphilus shinanonensis]|uniref:Cell shape-determining protein MreC n=1 Tax=Chitiniphilus shinanonensis TaxID=553088 RepID=A0ABQ6BNY9_9NEIS|nr:rod shape-determining protein MreC [Chitiniphilus shinanonensis]GLS03561.1 rod shape-determining protein MreC [Chitiniphilus shinanonensis]